MTDQQLSQIKAIQSELETMDVYITSQQNVSALIDLGGKLASWIAFTGEQQSNAKRAWRKEVARCYDNYVFSKMAFGMKVTPSMANKYAEAKSGEYEADYEMVERTHRSCVHILDFLRTCISALKQEMSTFNSQPL